MADVNIGSDTLLVTTLNDNDRVTITRQATSQQVATMKVADFRKIMCGIDYSTLVEQKVPGIFAYNKNRERSQVYVQSFLITARTDSDYTIIPLVLPDTGAVIGAWGAVLSGTVWANPITAASVIRYTSASNGYAFVHNYTFQPDGETIPGGAWVYITLKYVK